MPDSYPTKYRTLEQTLAWVAYRDPDRVNTAYKEWRDRYYEPRRSDWLSKDPLIWDWRSPADGLHEAAQALRQKCEAGALRGTGREGVGVDRSEIALLRWPDLMLVDIAGTTDGPQFYDSSADLLAIENRRVGPAFHDVLFTVADILAAFPAPGEAEEDSAPYRSAMNPAPDKARKVPLSEKIAFCRNLAGTTKNAKEMNPELMKRFGLTREECREVRHGAGFKGRVGRPPKTGKIAK